MQKRLEKFVLHLYKKYGITPDILTYLRIFSAPWLALLVSKILSNKSLVLAIFTVLLYALIVSTDFLDGILARELSKTEKHDHTRGGMLDRLSDKIFIIFLLIPFGFNLFTFLIILVESMLAYQAIQAPAEKKQATRVGKMKMILQAVLIPVLILQAATNLIPDMLVYLYIIVVIIFTCASAYSHYSHYFNFKNE